MLSQLRKLGLGAIAALVLAAPAHAGFVDISVDLSGDGSGLQDVALFDPSLGTLTNVHLSYSGVTRVETSVQLSQTAVRALNRTGGTVNLSGIFNTGYVIGGLGQSDARFSGSTPNHDGISPMATLTTDMVRNGSLVIDPLGFIDLSFESTPQMGDMIISGTAVQDFVDAAGGSFTPFLLAPLNFAIFTGENVDQGADLFIDSDGVETFRTGIVSMAHEGILDIRYEFGPPAVSAVPLPASLPLLGFGLFVLYWRRNK